MFMLKYFRGYHRPTKINQYEYLTHELFSHEIFPIYGTSFFLAAVFMPLLKCTKYNLGPIPFSLAYANGTLMTTNKSMLF